MSTPIEGYLRTTEAAQYLGVSRKTLLRLLERRKLPFIPMSKRLFVFRRADLDACMSRMRRPALGESNKP